QPIHLSWNRPQERPDTGGQIDSPNVASLRNFLIRRTPARRWHSIPQRRTIAPTTKTNPPGNQVVHRDEQTVTNRSICELFDYALLRPRDCCAPRALAIRQGNTLPTGKLSKRNA